MRRLAVAAVFFAVGGCSPSWPKDKFPAGVEVKRILFAGGGGGFRETCEAIVAELTDESASSVVRIRKTGERLKVVPPSGWYSTPLGDESGAHSYYKGAFGGCNDGQPLGDLDGALRRPGAFYKVINGGEGIAIIVPRAKLAGFFYFG